MLYRWRIPRLYQGYYIYSNFYNLAINLNSKTVHMPLNWWIYFSMYVNLGYVSMNFIPNETTEAFDGVRTPSGKSDASTTTSRRPISMCFCHVHGLVGRRTYVTQHTSTWTIEWYRWLHLTWLLLFVACTKYLHVFSWLIVYTCCNSSVTSSSVLSSFFSAT